jgi:hypothetical protein
MSTSEQTVYNISTNEKSILSASEVFNTSKYEEIYYKVKTQICTEEYLKMAINYLDLKTIYCNQILSEHFIHNYILNPEYHSCVEDSYIMYDDVKRVQEKIQQKVKARKNR